MQNSVHFLHPSPGFKEVLSYVPAIPKRPEVMRITVRSVETKLLLNISVQREEGQENKDEA